MSDELRLLLVLVVIYLADCVYWIPRGGMAVTHWIGGKWRLRTPPRALGNDRGGIGFAHPLPPLGLASRSLPWPISVSPRALYSYVSSNINEGPRPNQFGVCVQWASVKSIEREEKKLFVNDQLFFAATSAYSARFIGAELVKLWKIEEERRAPAIRELLTRTLEDEAVAETIDTFRKKSNALRIASNLLFVFLFAICPFLVWRFGLAATFLPIVAAIYAQTVAIGFVFRRRHKEFYPGCDSEILKPLAMIILAPLSAIRSQDLLCRSLLEKFHPLAVARSLCGEGEFQRLAGIVLRDLRYPRLPVVPHGHGEVAKETEEWFRGVLQGEMAAYLERCGQPAETFFELQEREADTRAYCPRCRQQFTSSDRVCEDCGGRPLARV